MFTLQSKSAASRAVSAGLDIASHGASGTGTAPPALFRATGGETGPEDPQAQRDTGWTTLTRRLTQGGSPGR